MKNKQQNTLLNILCIYIILQPFFDILSDLYVDGVLKIGISTYIKPLFVFGTAIYCFFKKSSKKSLWIIYSFLFAILLVGHFYVLHQLLVSRAVVLHEFRFLINIIYMAALLLIFNTLFREYEDKQEFLNKIKRTIILTFSIYTFLFFVAVLTNTSGRTYEYADELKRGYKGWFNSGQILGHSLSIMLPTIIYVAFKPRNKWYIRILISLPIFICICLLGTKVPFYILVAVLCVYFLVSIFNLIFVKHYKFNAFNVIYSLICIIVLIFSYNYLPVAYNTKLNKESLSKSIDSYDEEFLKGDKALIYIQQLIDNANGRDVRPLLKYKKVIIETNEYMYNLYSTKKLHPADTRKVEFAYSYKKYTLSPISYKIFGIGFLNQDGQASLESDFFMAILSFGILGLICFLIIPIYEFVRCGVYILRNFTNMDLETYLLYASLGIFFCISALAGYTYIYTNFSIYLVLLIFMIRSKININEKYKLEGKKINKVSFLMLHLGYGGIETATINTANALSKKYDVELVSLYKLKDSQVNNINNNVKVRYLYNGEPNRKEFAEAVKSKNILKILIEGFRAVKILALKKILVIKEIKFSKSDAIVSTRMEFSVLLSKYGKISELKIAQEHRHHNNDKKYIDTIKYKYINIDYLFALTPGLKSDYEKFLEDRNYIKIVVVPNMIKKENSKISNLKHKNLISVGRLHPGKRIDELVDIFSKSSLSSSKLYIIGDGEEYSNISNKIKDYNLENKVIMLGYKNHDEIEKYMLDSCIFLMASETEGLPMVLLEAMSYGLPCIAYETESGTKDIIKDNENGYLIKNRNQKDYIDKLVKLLKNSKKLDEMSKKSLNTVESFSEENILKIWFEVLK